MIKRIVFYLVAQAAIFVGTISFFKRAVPEFTAWLSDVLATYTGSEENIPIALGYGAICLLPLWLSRKHRWTLVCVGMVFAGWLMGRVTGPDLLPAVAFYFSLFCLCLFCHRYYMAAVSLTIAFYWSLLIKLYGAEFPTGENGLALIGNILLVALVSYPVFQKPKNRPAGESRSTEIAFKEAA